MALVAGFAITLGATWWVLRPALDPARPARPAPRACPKCGPRPERDARFCSNCGAALGR
jgi:hypothetical protein